MCQANKKALRQECSKYNRNGARGRIRTYDLWLRKPTLYPAELHALERMRQTYGFSHRAGKMKYILSGCSFPFGGIQPRESATEVMVAALLGNCQPCLSLGIWYNNLGTER